MVNQIINVLANKGYKAVAKEVIQNGIARQAIIVEVGEQNPTFYINETVSLEIQLENILNHLSSELLTFDLSFLNDYESVKNLVFPCICKHGNLGKDIVSKPILDFDFYIRVSVENSGTIAITNQLLENWEVDFDTIAKNAFENMINDSVSIDMNELFGNFKMPEKMFVITNNKNRFGASAILNTLLLDEISDRLNSDLFILPSSIHECLVVSAECDAAEYFLHMVKTINSDESIISPLEVLTNSVYRYDRLTKELRIEKAD